MNNKIDTLDNELANDTNSIGFTGAVPIKNKKDLLLLDEEESKKRRNNNRRGSRYRHFRIFKRRRGNKSLF